MAWIAKATTYGVFPPSVMAAMLCSNAGVICTMCASVSPAKRRRMQVGSDVRSLIAYIWGSRYESCIVTGVSGDWRVTHVESNMHVTVLVKLD
jgi:hypothetical protein